jgi:hypothetical protein
VARSIARQRVTSARRLRSSPARAGDEEGDEAKPVAGSPDHEQRWWSNATARKKVGEGSRLRGNGAGVSEGGARPFIGVRGTPGRQ